MQDSMRKSSPAGWLMTVVVVILVAGMVMVLWYVVHKMSLNPWGLGGCWGLLGAAGGWGAGGLIRSHGSLARSIPHSPNLLYVLNLQQQKSCDRLKLLLQIKQYEKSWIIGVYCPPMGIWDCRAAWKRVEKIGNSGGIYKSNNFPPLSLFGRNPLW